MKVPWLPSLFYLSMSLLFIAALIKLQHWPYADMALIIASVMRLCVTILMAIEIFSSKLADMKNKVIWGGGLIVFCAATFFLSGNSLTIILGITFIIFQFRYIRRGRKLFVGPDRHYML